jgi:uncharacterized protein YdaU (DUF1376 family)
LSELFYYPRYINDWRASRARLEMTKEQQSFYWDLLDFFYQFGHIPLSEFEIRQITNATKAEFRRCWPKVSEWFEERNGVLVQVKSEEIRRKLLVTREKQSQGGRRNAKNLAQFRSSSSPGHPEKQSPGDFPGNFPAHLPGDFPGNPVAESPANFPAHLPAHPSGIARADLKTHKLKSSAGGAALPEASSAATSASSASPSVGSLDISASKPGKRAGKKQQRSSPAGPDGSAGPASSLSEQASRTPRIVRFNGESCEVEVPGENGLKLLTMAIADAERMLSESTREMPSVYAATPPPENV